MQHEINVFGSDHCPITLSLRLKTKNDPITPAAPKIPILDQFENVIGDLETLFESQPVKQCQDTSESIPDSTVKIQNSQATVGARSRDVMTINLVPTKLKEGYLPRIFLNNENIFLGECLVTNENNTCKVLVVNTSDEDVTITVNPRELLDYEYYTPSFESDSDSNSNPPLDKKGRVERLNNLVEMSHLNEEERSHVQNLINDYHDVFLLPGDPLPASNVVQLEIVMENGTPIICKQHRLPPAYKEVIRKDVEEKLQLGVIEHSNSPMSSLFMIVPKKPDRFGNPRHRLVLDYRRVNKLIKGDSYPLPNINEILDQLRDSKYFSTFDLAHGYYQIEVKKEDRWKTAFATPGFGHYQFRRVPMGLKSSPACFERMLETVLNGLNLIKMFIYLDDVIVPAKSLPDNNRKVRLLLDRLRAANLVLQPDKVQLLKDSVTFLGHVVSEKGVSPDPSKIGAVKNYPTPTCIKDVRSALGLFSYYHRFIHKFSEKAKPLYDLLKKENKFEWGPDQETSMQVMKEHLTSAPILVYPDFNKTFKLTVDSSAYAIGAVLSQEYDGFDHPVAYLSRTLNKAEQNYSCTERECLACLYSMKAFRHYLLGRRFKLVSDHEPLNYMHTRQDPGSRLTRWMLRFIDYEYDFEYRKGKLNVNADALSRYPSEKEINDKLPTLRICVIPRPTEKTNSKAHRTRATTIDADKPQPKKEAALRV